jgi:hypothetical protein
LCPPSWWCWRSFDYLLIIFLAIVVRNPAPELVDLVTVLIDPKYFSIQRLKSCRPLCGVPMHLFIQEAIFACLPREPSSFDFAGAAVNAG